MKSIRRIALTTLFCGSMSWGQSAPESAQINQVTLTGTGCDEASASASLSPDAKDLSLLFDNYLVEIGQGSSSPKAMTAQKNCRVDIDITVPRGWQYAFKSVDYRGFVSLPASAWGFHRIATMSANSIVPSLREVTHMGPLDQEYTFRVDTRPDRRIWSTCLTGSHRMILYSQLGVSFYPRSSDRTLATVNLDSQDFSAKQSLGLEWRRCQPVSNPTPPPPDRPRRPRF